MKCVFCKKEISNDSKFCEYCGRKVENSPVEEEITLEEPKKIKTEEDLKIEKSIDKRIYKWKEKLIDLSKRNRLLCFKTSKYSTFFLTWNLLIKY